jgi:hypothetical protein
VFRLSTYEAFDRNLVRTGAAVTVVCPLLLCSTGVVYEYDTKDTACDSLVRTCTTGINQGPHTRRDNAYVLHLVLPSTCGTRSSSSAAGLPPVITTQGEKHAISRWIPCTRASEHDEAGPQVNAKLRACLVRISQPAPSVGRAAGGYHRRLSQVRLGRGGGGYSQLRSSIGALTPVSVGGASCRERPTGSRRCRRAAACLSDPASSPPHQRARAEEAREVTRPLMLTRSLTRRGVTGRRPEAVRA